MAGRTLQASSRARNAIIEWMPVVWILTEKVTDMKKTLFAIKNLFEREKSLKDYAWYIWF